MKIMKILYQIILITILIVMCSSCVCFAETDRRFHEAFLDDDGGGTQPGSVTGDESTGLPDINSNYKPRVDFGSTGTSKSIIEKILGVLVALGGIVGVISIALIGFNTILGSASEKAANQEKYIGVLIGAALITSGSIIAQMIVKFAESI